ncbi:hypothetical protein ACFYKX_09725 [Cytobacillus sp. FJAT-54145]|uniref:Preprotein translocase subunit SecB n=1 Tax=Cytobacillus spartinae TaxID=3299023 RepID=A0ABW6K9R1_9BACI
MSKNVVSELRFNDFAIDRMVFQKNHTYTPTDKEIGLEFGLSAEASISSEMDESIIVLNCKIFEENFDEHNVPFFLELSMRGYFNCSQDFNIEDFQFNGMAILLPYLRSVITSFTAQSGISPVILPPINVYKVFKRDGDSHDD